MRIGEFAGKHNVSVDTIRYYLNLQLLLSEKDGHQYRFTEEDSRDMEEILELKDLKFSLEEIQHILTYKRLTSDKDNTFIEHYRSFLKEKKEEIKSHKEELDVTLHYINGKIHEAECDGKDIKILGLPLKALNILACPYCDKRLNLSEGHIENNMIVSGKFQCSCDNILVLENGIIIKKESIKTKPLPSKQEYYEKTSPKFINFVFKSIASLINIISDDKIKKEYVLEISNCCGFFLMNYLPNLDRETTFIVVDYDLSRLKKLKCDLEANYEHENFIFICSNYDELPIKANSLDLILDCFTNGIHGAMDGKILSQSYYPMIKDKGTYGTILSYFDSNNTRIKGIPEGHRKYYEKKNLVEMIEGSGIKARDIRTSGPVAEGGEYNIYVEGNNYSHMIYLGEK